MFNNFEQLLVLLISSIGVFYQTLNVKNPFNPKDIKELLKISYNISLYYVILTGGIVIAGNFLLAPLWTILEQFIPDRKVFIGAEILIINIIYFLVKLIYVKMVKRKDEEDFLTRFLTGGNRRNKPFDFPNPADKVKVDYTISYIIKPSLTSVIYLTLCVIISVGLFLLKIALKGNY